GGGSQRINLAAARGSSLTETMCVIDEPTVGVHAGDSGRLLAVLRRMKNAGNTVIVVEHDPTIIAGADHTIDVGAGAGELGGEVTYEGRPRDTGRGAQRAPAEATEEGAHAVRPSRSALRNAREP